MQVTMQKAEAARQEAETARQEMERTMRAEAVRQQETESMLRKTLADIIFSNEKYSAAERQMTLVEAQLNDLTIQLHGRTNALNAMLTGYNPVNDQSSAKSSLSNSSFRTDIVPLKFVPWEDLDRDIYIFLSNPEVIEILRKVGLMYYEKSTIHNDRLIRSELVLQEALNHIFQDLTSIFGRRIVTAFHAECTLKQHPPADGISWIGDLALSVTELNCSRILSEGYDLVSQVNRYMEYRRTGDSAFKPTRMDVPEAFEQLLGYMQHAGVSIGVLTTVNHTFAVQRLGDTVRVSPKPRLIESSGTGSLLSLLYYLTCLAEKAPVDPELHYPLLNFLHGPKGGRGPKGGHEGGDGKDRQGSGSGGSGGSGGGGAGGGGSGGGKAGGSRAGGAGGGCIGRLGSSVCKRNGGGNQDTGCKTSSLAKIVPQADYTSDKENEAPSLVERAGPSEGDSSLSVPAAHELEGIELTGL